MKRKLVPFLFVIILLFTAGCSDDSAGTFPINEKAVTEESSSSNMKPDSESSSVESNDIIQQMHSLYQQLDHSRLPLQEYDNWCDTTSEMLAELPKQLVIDTPESYRYAQIIRNYLDFGGNKLSDFDDIESMSFQGVISTAIYHTQPIQWQGTFSTKIEEIDDGPYANHALRALVINEKGEDHSLSELYYADDVQYTIQKMFGDQANIINMSAELYTYYKRENVYGQLGDYGGPAWCYPILTRMESTNDGMICEVILVQALDKNTPLQTIGQNAKELTSDNFEAMTAKSAKYRYTFVEGPKGMPILTSLHTLR